MLFIFFKFYYSFSAHSKAGYIFLFFKAFVIYFFINDNNTTS